MTPSRRIVVGITGASGAIYGVRALELLKAADVETHLVVSASGQITLAQELSRSPAEIAALADVTYRIQDIGAAIASGSFLTGGMLVAPCSIRTLSEIASGVTSSLLTRAADVALKERRRLILMVRETPFHLGHLRSMVQATEAGAIVMPPVPAFYPLPQTVDEIVDHTIGRALDLLGIEADAVRRWSGTAKKRRAPEGGTRSG
jgi:4-hydroxy-3-polyprenylbenzoate decarboxylase